MSIIGALTFVDICMVLVWLAGLTLVLFAAAARFFASRPTVEETFQRLVVSGNYHRAAVLAARSLVISSYPRAPGDLSWTLKGIERNRRLVSRLFSLQEQFGQEFTDLLRTISNLLDKQQDLAESWSGDVKLQTGLRKDWFHLGIQFQELKLLLLKFLSKMQG